MLSCSITRTKAASAELRSVYTTSKVSEPQEQPSTHQWHDTIVAGSDSAPILHGALAPAAEDVPLAIVHIFSFRSLGERERETTLSSVKSSKVHIVMCIHYSGAHLAASVAVTEDETVYSTLRLTPLLAEVYSIETQAIVVPMYLLNRHKNGPFPHKQRFF